MAIIDFRVRPPFKGFLDMVLYANPERRDRFRPQMLEERRRLSRDKGKKKRRRR